MKRFRNMLIAAAAGLLTLTGLSLHAAAARQFPECIDSCKVYDIQGVLSEDEEAEVNTIIRETSDDIDMYIGVYIVGPETSFPSDSAVETYADDRYDALFNPQQSVDTDGVLLVINNSTQYDYLSTSGLGQLYYYNGEDDDRTWKILENITPYLKQEDYAGAVTSFCVQLSNYYERGVPKDKYAYDSHQGLYYFYKDGKLVSAKRLPWWFGVNFQLYGGMGLIVGVIAAFITYLVVLSKYRLVKGISPTNYISEQETHYHVREDHFLREHTSKSRISSDSGGRSGGGGHSSGGHSHSSSGGHSHGGGGHHR